MGLTLEGAVARSNHFVDTANAEIAQNKVVFKSNVKDEVDNFSKYTENYVYSANDAFKKGQATYVEPVSFEVVDNNTEAEVEKTGFYSATFLTSADNMFAAPVEKVEDKVSDDSFIISKDELSNLSKQEVRPIDSFTEALTPVVEEVKETPVVPVESFEPTPVEENEGEVISFEQEKAKVKTLGKLKKAGYIDTVILCLIAQLSIFGLLIIVLLIIK